MEASSIGPTDSPVPIVIVGAGLAGLSCAAHLRRANRGCLVIEASDDVGGRVRTDVVEGFRLDRGFQVLLTAYPEASRCLDLTALDPRAFSPGALVRFGERFHRVSDPLRRPSHAFDTLRSPVGSLADKLRIARLRRHSTRGTLDDALGGADMPTRDLLAASGVGSDMIDRFLRPFLGGIFLERELDTSSRMFHFVFRMFASGDAVVPALGMGEIARQLASALPEGSIRFGSSVVEIDEGRVVLAGGEVVACDRVVVATDGDSAARLVAGVRRPDWCDVTCLYFSADEAPIQEPALILNGESTGPINNLCFPTQVSPSYGPDGRTLVSASVIGSDAASADIEDRVRAHLVEWFGDVAGNWTHLRTYRIPHALPRQAPGWLDPVERPHRAGQRVYVAGDHLDTASSNGALRSGRRAAEAVLADLGAQEPEPGS